MYAHLFKWLTVTNEEDNLLSPAQRRKAKSNQNTEYTMSAGGSRNESDSSLLDSTQKKLVLNQKYRQSYYTTENSCSWLAAAMLINVVDEKSSNVMIEEITKNPLNFDWLHFTKVPKSEKDENVYQQNKTMIQLLQKIVGYTLVKVRNRGTFVDFLFDPQTKGLYLCTLETNIGSKTHVIGVDCSNKTIFDCMEDYSLCLSKENLDYCCGQDAFGLKSICSCFSVVTLCIASSKFIKHSLLQ